MQLSYVILCAAGVALASAGPIFLGQTVDSTHLGAAGAAAQARAVVDASILANNARAVRYNGALYYLYNGAFYFPDGRPCPSGYLPISPKDYALKNSDAVQHDAAYHGNVAGFPYNYGGYAYGAFPAATAYNNNYAPQAYNAAYGPARFGNFYNNNPFLRFPFKN